jgi:VanZ family protein
MKKLLENKKLFKLLFWIWLLVIFILSSLPNIPTQKINVWDEPWRLDYVEHFLVFGALAGLFVLWKSKQGKFQIKNYYLPLLGLIIFAAADEIHQIWIPGRSFNPLDLIYNILGLISFFIISPYILKRIYKN